MFHDFTKADDMPYTCVCSVANKWFHTGGQEFVRRCDLNPELWMTWYWNFPLAAIHKLYMCTCSRRVSQLVIVARNVWFT